MRFRLLRSRRPAVSSPIRHGRRRYGAAAHQLAEKDREPCRPRGVDYANVNNSLSRWLGACALVCVACSDDAASTTRSGRGGSTASGTSGTTSSNAAGGGTPASATGTGVATSAGTSTSATGGASNVGSTTTGGAGRSGAAG